MKRSTSACLAFVSAAVLVATPRAARPQYGGVLRVEMASAIRALDPSATASDAAEAAARARVLPLIFDTLTRVDADGGLQAGLARDWQSERQETRWRFHLRQGIVLHDGTPLQPWQVATALRAIEKPWRVATEEDTLIVDLPEPVRDLPWRLADVSHGIAVKSGDGWLGTGPFRVERLEPATIVLRAHDGHRQGRPFLDGVRIEMGRSLSAQLADLDADRADLISVQPTDARRVAERGMHVAATKPIELVAIVFEPHRTDRAFEPERRSLAAAFDREAMCSVLLQRHAAPATGLLPGWLSGYSRAAPARGVPLAPTAVAALPVDRRELVLRVDPADSLAVAIAERAAVDAREGGFALKVQAAAGLAPRADARLVRVRLAPTAPDRALADLAARLGPRALAGISLTAVPDAVARDEASILETAVVVPLAHLEEVYAHSDRVMSWRSKAVVGSGEWDFSEVWLRSGRP